MVIILWLIGVISTFITKTQPGGRLPALNRCSYSISWLCCQIWRLGGLCCEEIKSWAGKPKAWLVGIVLGLFLITTSVCVCVSDLSAIQAGRYPPTHSIAICQFCPLAWREFSQRIRWTIRHHSDGDLPSPSVLIFPLTEKALVGGGENKLFNTSIKIKPHRGFSALFSWSLYKPMVVTKVRLCPHRIWTLLLL